ncbi:MAG: response regulator [Anaerolineae bacterium]|jgi:CheY-like chemotaxis protein|nr:response regulator [Anaerolineae bacterium]MDX9830812.1 response regulator [Anaerolineae bacterium]
MSGAKILCIEDDPDMIEYIKLILGRAGYTVIGADGGVEGLDAMRREKPDLILLDLMMPDMDGAEVLLRKKQEPTIRDIPVIALTALNSPFDQIMWLARTDLQDFIVKSKLPRRELIARIERVLKPSDPATDEGAD